MNEYLYDGSFEGLLTAIFYAYQSTEESKITKSEEYLPNFLSNVINITTEEDKFNRVYKSIKEKLSSSTLKNVYYLYLFNVHATETLILQYLKLCYKYGDKINLAKNNDTIILVDKYYRAVSLEAHRFTGFVRFREISPSTYYSIIEPDHNILPLLINHFTKRFSDQNFIIYDSKREYAIVYNKQEAILTPISKDEAIKLEDSCLSDNFEVLWKEFYKAINIKERQNIKLQKRSMPIRYWKNLTELN